MAFDGDDFTKVLKYPFQDPQWFSKMALQGAALFLLCIVLVGIPFLMGYMIRCTQKGLKGETTLPGWDEWGDYWRLGWKAFGVNLLYLLPIYGVYGLLVVGYLVLIDIDETSLTIIGSIVAIVGYIAILLYGIALIFIQAAVNAAIALNRSFYECFELKSRIWPYIKANIGAILFAMVAGWVAGFVSYLGFFAFFVGILFTFNYFITVNGYSQGIVHHKSKIKL